MDNGQTTLLSPPLNLSGSLAPVISYYRWYCDASNTDDEFVVDISADSGKTWVNLETVRSSEREWVQRRFLVADYVVPSEEVFVRFIASDFNNGSLVEAAVDDFEVLALDTTLVVVEEREALEGLPRCFLLAQNFPNPCNPLTNIRYQLPQACPVTLKIYNVLGQKVDVLLDHSWHQAGYYSIRWDASAYSNGVYFCCLQAGTWKAVRRIVVLK